MTVVTTGSEFHMETVGVRELKANLSRHLKRVRAGARLTVIERGRSIATISPVETPADVDWAHKLVAEGRAHWSGGKPAGSSRPARISRDKTVSGAVLEDRGETPPRYQQFGEVVRGRGRQRRGARVR
jgi:antitoxin (DNA-binding transcriptional repressor) of toxin-antitoxin stability system